MVAKCKLCSRENSIDILADSIKPYSNEAGQFQTIVAFDCRGLEPVEFEVCLNLTTPTRFFSQRRLTTLVFLDLLIFFIDAEKVLSATEYIPTRTIIQAGWVSASLSLSSLSSPFSRWDNSRTL